MDVELLKASFLFAAALAFMLISTDLPINLSRSLKKVFISDKSKK